ncbi:MAG: ABC transporter substrate-binding protein [Clostridiales bacterium]|nr:ABC transporter substrate-binding protein [Clostridiales bacterium]
MIKRGIRNRKTAWGLSLILATLALSSCAEKSEEVAVAEVTEADINSDMVTEGMVSDVTAEEKNGDMTEAGTSEDVADTEKNRDRDVAGNESLILTDDLGRTVSVPYQPQRTAVLIGSFADVWQLAGGTVTATANDAWTSFDLNLSEDTVNLGTTRDLSLELLFACEPDLVIASSNTQIDLDWMETLEGAEIPTLYFDVADFESYLNMLDICTQITGRTELYQENGLDIQSEIDEAIEKSRKALEERTAPPTVLYLRASAASIKAKDSRDNVLGEMLGALGCMNIADGSVYLDDLSLEQIIADDPEFIFIVEQGQDTDTIEKNLDELLRDTPAWSGLSAVREGRVYYMDPGLYNLKPNRRWGEAYENLEKILYES